MRKILNSKEVKRIHTQLRAQYGFTGRLDGVLLLQEKKQKLYLATRTAVEFDTQQLRLEAIGTYVGAFFDGQLRLSVEGSQLIGPECTENVVEISHDQMQQWIQGETLPAGDLPSGEFVIVKHGKDFLGCGKVARDEILNYVPKTRYVHATY